jgi:Flp pilus assembly protein TadB
MVRKAPVKAIFIGFIAIAAVAATAGCQKSDEQMSSEATTQLIVQKNTEISALKAEVEALRAAASRRPAVTGVEASQTKQPTKSADRPTQAMCFKDYCPCDEEQAGMEKLLCDRLEAGLPVETEMMINARSMLDVRRQIASGDY